MIKSGQTRMHSHVSNGKLNGHQTKTFFIHIDELFLKETMMFYQPQPYDFGA